MEIQKRVTKYAKREAKWYKPEHFDFKKNGNNYLRLYLQYGHQFSHYRNKSYRLAFSRSQVKKKKKPTSIIL